MAQLSKMSDKDIEWLMSHEPGANASMPSAATRTMPLAPPSSRAAATPNAAMPQEIATGEDSEDSPSVPIVNPTLSHRDAEQLLRQAELAVQSMQTPPASALPPGASPFQLHELQEATVPAEAANLDLIRDVELNLKIELGRTEMTLEDVLKLRRGSVVALDKLAGEPVDVYANGRLIARGEVVVLEDNFCVRVVELVAGVGKAA
jgi:flagellar motor switch protein FliN